MIYTIHDILKYLPHRYPFLLIDRIESFEIGKSVTALKNVTYNEPYFTGHFPELPVMPGVLILEAMAQAAGILILDPSNPALFLFAGVDNARFKQVVSPGDQLYLHIHLMRGRQDVWKFHAEAKVDNKLVCEADLILAKKRGE